MKELCPVGWCAPVVPPGSATVFVYIFAEECLRRTLMPYPPNELAPPQREILDPPLGHLVVSHLSHDSPALTDQKSER